MTSNSYAHWTWAQFIKSRIFNFVVCRTWNNLLFLFIDVCVTLKLILRKNIFSVSKLSFLKSCCNVVITHGWRTFINRNLTYSEILCLLRLFMNIDVFQFLIYLRITFIIFVTRCFATLLFTMFNKTTILDVRTDFGTVFL